MVKRKTVRPITATQEDYLETILYLIGRNTVARNKEIAELLDVSKATVTGSIKKLAAKGLVNYKSHGHITLTENGRDIAEKIREKHNLFTHFFHDILGISHTESEKVACAIEHVIRGEAYERFSNLISAISNCSCEDRIHFDRIMKDD